MRKIGGTDGAPIQLSLVSTPTVPLEPVLGMPTPREQVLCAEDLLAADEVFITSTLKECCPVRAIDGRQVGPVQPGPVTLQILRRYRERARPSA